MFAGILVPSVPNRNIILLRCRSGKFEPQKDRKNEKFRAKFGTWVLGRYVN